MNINDLNKIAINAVIAAAAPWLPSGWRVSGANCNFTTVTFHSNEYTVDTIITRRDGQKTIDCGIKPCTANRIYINGVNKNKSLKLEDRLAKYKELQKELKLQGFKVRVNKHGNGVYICHGPEADFQQVLVPEAISLMNALF